MKRTVSILVTVFMAALALSMTVQAGPPTAAAGLWRYTPYLISMKVADGNTFLHTFENGEWTGTFEGDSTEEGHVVIHSTGAWSFRGTVTFSQVTVDGRSGTLEMRVAGERPDVFTDWEGRWVITGGTGDLVNLRGQGTWWGPGAPDLGLQGDIWYAGQIHFEP
jgi:hypothetical protein